MNAAFTLDAGTVRVLDDLVATGRWATREDALREGVQLLCDRIAEEAEPLSAAEIAGIEAGLAQAERGELIPADRVFADLERRYKEWR